MLFIVHTAGLLSHNNFIWVYIKRLHKLLIQNKNVFSSKNICDLSSVKCPPVVPLSKIARQPDLDASACNKKLQFGICFGTLIFLSKLLLASLNARILKRSSGL